MPRCQPRPPLLVGDLPHVAILAPGADRRSPLRHDAGVTSGTNSRLQRGLVVLGIVVLAFNLRPSAVSVGPVLGEVSDGLGMTTPQTGVLTSLPVLAFAVFGALAPRLAGVLGLHRLTLVALLCVVGGLAGRASVSSVPLFLVLSLVALAGMATANVLLPSLVKLHFPDRVGLMTSIYTTALAIGLTSASVLTVPISEAYDGWRSGLLVWAFTAAHRGTPLARPDRARPPARGGRGQDRSPRRCPHAYWLAARPVLRAPVPAGLLDLRLVRRALPGCGVLRAHGGAAARRHHRRQHSAVVPDPVRSWRGRTT